MALNLGDDTATGFTRPYDDQKADVGPSISTCELAENGLGAEKLLLEG